jgi:hypothetical protein
MFYEFFSMITLFYQQVCCEDKTNVAMETTMVATTNDRMNGASTNVHRKKNLRKMFRNQHMQL